MIIAIFLFLGGFVISILASILGLLNFIIPTQVFDAITWFFSYLDYFRGVFPVSTALQAFALYLSAVVLIYSVKIFMWVLSHVPGIRPGKFPAMSTSQRSSLKGRV